jgi:hypothetical protein
MFKLKDGRSMADFLKKSKELMTIWKPVLDYEGYYEVSNFGEVRSLERKGRKKERILKPHLNGDTVKYLAVTLHKNGKMETRKVHHLVLEAFVGPRPENMYALHGPKGHLDNSVANLYWGTQQRNCSEDKLRDGTLPIGEKNGKAKLTEDEVREIYKLAWNGELTQREIVKMFNTTQANVSRIKHGRRWPHLMEDE